MALPLRPLRLLEHVNLCVPDAALARRFYVDGLGCALNPVASNERRLHLNLGCSQFHLPFKLREPNGALTPVTDAHVLPGKMVLATEEPLDALAARLGQILPREVQVEQLAERLAVRGPWGNRFEVERLAEAEAEAVRALGGHDGGSGAMLALRQVVLQCRPGTSEGIARQYREVLRCPADARDGRCEVRFDAWPAQALVFEEDPEAPPADAYTREEARRFHVAIYLREESFFPSFARAAQEGLVLVDERFHGLARESAPSPSLEEAERSFQYRLRDFRGEAAAGKRQLLLQLEHEVRSPRHKCFPFGRPRL